jgi:hypothetical protein
MCSPMLAPAVALPRMLEQIETELATAGPGEKPRASATRMASCSIPAVTYPAVT